MPGERNVQLVHHVPGRTRIRLNWLREEPEDARRIANELAERPGLLEIRVQLHTGSVLCLHDPALGAEAILREIQRVTGVKTIMQPGQQRPPPPAAAARRGSAVGHHTLELFRDLDRDLHRATEGKLNLSTLAVTTFAGVAALNVVTTGELPLPPWYSLAWWSFRVLWTVEREAHRADDAAASKRLAPRGRGARKRPRPSK
jgi:hypothetical protein